MTMKALFAVGLLHLAGIVSSTGPAPAPAALLQSPAPAAGADNAVTKVVDLLTQLKSRIEADGAAEQKAFDNYACWCETTTDRKAKSITQVRADLLAMGRTILGLRGSIATLTSEIADLTRQIKENEEAQQLATSIRQKENANFVAEKAEMEQAVAALEKAMQVLTAATSASAMVQRTAIEKVKSVASRIQQGAGNPRKLTSLVSALSRLTADTKNYERDRYTPQSATIQGILSDMYATFANDIQSATLHEGTQQRNFEAFIHAKQQELKTLQDTVLRKEQAKSEAEIQLADATQSYADSEAQLAADIKFFDEAKAACVAKADEWTERSTMRTAELNGIEEALTILTSDEAAELFPKAIKPGFAASDSFLQVASVPSAATGAEKAFKVLQEHARKTHSVRLAAIAASVRVQAKSRAFGHFDTVITAIDNLIESLVQEQTDDDNAVDQCKSQRQEIALAKQDLNWKIKNNQAAIQKLEAVISEKEAEVATTVEDINQVVNDISQMEATRVSGNQEFLQAKDDDQKAIQLLESAKEALVRYFDENNIEVGPLQLVQGHKVGAPAPAAATGQQIDDMNAAPDARFSDKASRKGESKGVISIITMIIEDLKNEISAGQKAETEAQLAFEAQLAAAKKLEADLNTKKTNLEEQLANANSEKTSEEGTLSDNQGELQIQEDTETSIKPHCDFITIHQETRRSKRKEEMDGLKKAKEFLLGFSQVSMLQKKPKSFDDNALSRISFKAVSFLQKNA